MNLDYQNRPSRTDTGMCDVLHSAGEVDVVKVEVEEDSSDGSYKGHGEEDEDVEGVGVSSLHSRCPELDIAVGRVHGGCFGRELGNRLWEEEDEKNAVGIRFDRRNQSALASNPHMTFL